MSHRINTLIAEDKLYQEWERAIKNRILAMHNPVRKMELWKKYFGEHQKPDDSYLEGNIF